MQYSYAELYLTKFSNIVMAALQVANLESERDYLHQALRLQAEGKTNFYCIFSEDNNELIGAIEIRNPDFSRGQLYTWVHQDYWGRGVFQEALHLAAQDYFATTKALCFDATVDLTNIRSYKALKKAGFADISIKEGAHGKQFVLIFRNKSLKD